MPFVLSPGPEQELGLYATSAYLLAPEYNPALDDQLAYYVTSDGRTVLAFDPLRLEVRWARNLAQTGNAITSFHSWPTDFAAFITTVVVSGANYSLRWHDDTGDVISSLTYTNFGRILAIDYDGTIFWRDENNTPPRVIYWRRAVDGAFPAPDKNTSQLGGNDTFITPGHPFGCPSIRRKGLAVGPAGEIYVVKSDTDYATQQRPQTLILCKYPATGGAASWTVAVATNNDPQSTLGQKTTTCELGSIFTDESGIVYLTYWYHDAKFNGRWYMRAFRGDTGAAVFNEIPVAGPGYPHPSSVQGSKLRYAARLADHASEGMNAGLVGYYRLDEGTSDASMWDHSGNARHGSHVSSPPSAAGLLTNDPNVAKDYDGVADYSTVAHNTAFNPTTGSFTVECLVQTTAQETAVLVTKGGASWWELGLEWTGSQLRASMSALGIGNFPSASAGMDDGKPHRLRFVIDRDTGLRYLYKDGVLMVSSAVAATSITNTDPLYIARNLNGAVFFDGIIDEVKMWNYANHDFGHNTFKDGPKTVERYLSAVGSFDDQTSQVDLELLTSDAYDIPEPGTDYNPRYDPLEKLPLALSPRKLEAGGVFELLEKSSITGELERIAFVSDLTAGLVHTPSLRALDRVEFTIALDRFVPTAGGAAFLVELQRQWQAAKESDDPLKGPYDRASLVEDHIYCRYTDKLGRQFLFRIIQLESQDHGILRGTAVDAAIELADYLTQYQAGRSQFLGNTPSEIADHILSGNQSIKVQNRRFTNDAPIRLFVADEIPDFTPVKDAGGVVRNPKPLAISIAAVNPNDADLFSGIPADTVGPNGSTRPLTTGFYGYMSWNDPDAASAGFFTTPVQHLAKAGPLDLQTVTAREAGENQYNTSRCFYLAVKADFTGLYNFKIICRGGIRAYFRGQQIKDDLRPNIADTVIWSSELQAGNWYPLIIHTGNVSPLDREMRLFWTVPGASEVLIPADHMSAELFRGVGTVRYTDVDGAVNFMTAYKAWDGRGIVLATPVRRFPPATITSTILWPKTSPAGTMIEEVRATIDKPLASIFDWGTGWTRRGGVYVNPYPSNPSTRFQSRAKGY